MAERQLTEQEKAGRYDQLTVHIKNLLLAIDVYEQDYKKQRELLLESSRREVFLKRDDVSKVINDGK